MGIEIIDRKQLLFRVENEEYMSDCSQHKKELAGISDMKVLAEMIGDLYYESLSELLSCLFNKIANDSWEDYEKDRFELAKNLRMASESIYEAYEHIKKAWQISKPFMEK